MAPMEQIWAQKEVLDRAGGWNPPSVEVAEFCARRFIANDPIALADYSDLLISAPDLTDQAAACPRAHRPARRRGHRRTG